MLLKLRIELLRTLRPLLLIKSQLKIIFQQIWKKMENLKKMKKNGKFEKNEKIEKIWKNWKNLKKLKKLLLKIKLKYLDIMKIF